MEQILTSTIGFKSWIPKTEIYEIAQGSTAMIHIPITTVKYEFQDEKVQEQTLPKHEFWTVDLGGHWEFTRKEIYGQVNSYRHKYSGLRS